MILITAILAGTIYNACTSDSMINSLQATNNASAKIAEESVKAVAEMQKNQGELINNQTEVVVAKLDRMFKHQIAQMKDPEIDAIDLRQLQEISDSLPPLELTSFNSINLEMAAQTAEPAARALEAASQFF